MSDRTNAEETETEIDESGTGSDTAEAETEDSGSVEGNEEGGRKPSADDEGGEENEVVAGEEEAKPSRGSANYHEAIARAEDATRRAEAAEQRLREREARENQDLTKQQREAKLAALSPEQRLEFLANEAMARVDHQTRVAEFRNSDLADKSEFLSKISGHQNLMALKDEVENRLTSLRNQGQNVTREVMMKFVLGEKAYQSVFKGTAKKQRTAARKISAARPRTPLAHAGK